jgi:hypothetical protein
MIIEPRLRKHVLMALGFVVLTMLLQTVHAATIDCTSMSGHAFYFQGSIVTESSSGWSTDKYDRDAKYSIIMERENIAESGSSWSARNEGASVSILSANPDDGLMSIMVVYPESAVEIFTYSKPMNVLTISQVKHGNPVNKVSLHTAKCGSLY